MEEIKQGAFCTAKNSAYVEYGVKKASFVYVIGNLMAKVDAKDPYLQRKMLLVVPLRDGKVELGSKPMAVDGLNFTAVSKVMQEKFEDALNSQVRYAQDVDDTVILSEE